MKKWEFDIMDLHGLKSCEVEIADHIKFKAQTNPDIKNLLNLAWGIYVRNAPVFLTVPLPDGFKEKEILIYRKGSKILIT